MKYLTSWWERFLFGIEVENIARTEKWLDDFDKARLKDNYLHLRQIG